MAKGKKPVKQSESGKKMSDNISNMPGGSPEAPGPINNPNNHPIDNVPSPTDPRWGDELQAMAAGQGGM